MKVAFLGTSKFAVPSLSALLSDPSISVECVITQEDRPKDRGHRVQPPPVKVLALEHGIAIYQPLRIRNEESKALIEKLSPDLIIVVSYGQILPKWLLELPAFGAINVHASLLPKYRGAAPIQWAILRGEETTGITTMLMDEGLDTGPILLQHAIEIQLEESAGELHDRLALQGAELLLNTVHRLQQGSLVMKPQEHEFASLAPKIAKEMAHINWSNPARDVHNLVRAFNPWPGAIARIRENELKIWKSRLWTGMTEAACPILSPAEIQLASKNRLIVGCGDGFPLELLEVSLPSRNRIAAAELASGLRLKSGEFFKPSASAS
jgi:methionyl-tRNA formyltransferase